MALGAIHYRDWREDRINLYVNISEYVEENDDSEGQTEYLRIIAQNFSKKPVTIEDFWLALQYNGKERKVCGVIENLLKDDKGSISFPVKLHPEEKLLIVMQNHGWLRCFEDYETREYKIPENNGFSLIAYFVDRRGKYHKSPPSMLYAYQY